MRDSARADSPVEPTSDPASLSHASTDTSAWVEFARQQLPSPQWDAADWADVVAEALARARYALARGNSDGARDERVRETIARLCLARPAGRSPARTPAGRAGGPCPRGSLPPAEGGPECFGPLQVAAFVRGERACPQPEHIRGTRDGEGCAWCRMLVRAVARTEAEEARSAVEGLSVLATAGCLAPDDPVLQACLLDARQAVAAELRERGSRCATSPPATGVARRSGLRRWLPIATGAVLLAVAVGIAAHMRHGRGPEQMLPLASLVRRSDDDPQAHTGIATVRGPGNKPVQWAIEGMRAVGGFRAGNRDLVAVGFEPLGEGSEGVLQVRNPAIAPDEPSSIVDSLPLVPRELDPFPLPDESEGWLTSQIIPVPGPGGQDLLVAADCHNVFSDALTRYRWASDGLQRIATYFHAGAVGHVVADSRDAGTLIAFSGVANRAPADHWPGQYFSVLGLIRLEDLESGLWQDPSARGRLGLPIRTGLERVYAIFVPVPGFPHESPIDLAWRVGADEGDGTFAVRHDDRWYRLDADGCIHFDSLAAGIDARHGPAARELISSFMGGCANQVVSVPPHRTIDEFMRWRNRWIRDTYLPAVAAWRHEALAAADAGRLSPRFVADLRTDLASIEHFADAVR